MRKVVILTALPEERRAVRAQLGNWNDDCVLPSGTIYDHGIFNGPRGSWDVYVTEMGHGNVAATRTAQEAINHFSPNLFIFSVGIAGGLHDVRPGDVVVSDRVYHYEPGRAGVQFWPHHEVGLPAHGLVQRALAVAHGRWQQRVQGNPLPNPPQASIGAIAAGAQVLDSADTATWRHLNAHYNNALAIETEGYGALAAANANQGVQAIVIRGISNTLDNQANPNRPNFQDTAAHYASAFAFEMLAQMPADGLARFLSRIRRRLLAVFSVFVAIALLITLIIVIPSCIPKPPPPNSPLPISEQTKTVNGDKIVTGISKSDGSDPSFTTSQALADDNNLPLTAEGESCIDQNNKYIMDQNEPYVIAVDVEYLSITQHDQGVSFAGSNSSLQGFCMQQAYYNCDQQADLTIYQCNNIHPVKIRLLIANLGTKEVPVLQQTSDIVTKQILSLAQQDSTSFIGVVGFGYSKSLSDPADNITSMNTLSGSHIPVVSPTASISNLSSQWKGDFFRINPGDNIEGMYAASYAYNTLGKRTAFVFLNQGDPYSGDLGNIFQRDFQGATRLEYFTDQQPNDTDESATINKDIADVASYLSTQTSEQISSDMIFCACYAQPDFKMLSDTIHNNIQKYPMLNDILLMGGDGLASLSPGSVYHNMYFTTFAFPDTAKDLCDYTCSQEQNNFTSNYCQQFDNSSYKQDMQYLSKCQSYRLSRPLPSAMLSYDALSTLLCAYDVYEQVSSTSNSCQKLANNSTVNNSTSLFDDVRSELPNIVLQGVTGWIQLSNASSDPVNKMVLVIYVSPQNLGRPYTECGAFTEANAYGNCP